LKQRNPLASATLFVGVLVSTGLLAAGLAQAILHPERLRQDLPPLSSLLHGILTADPVATINAGLLVLMFTPLARVIVVTGEFVRDREYSFALISIGVLLLLTMSVVIATL